MNTPYWIAILLVAIESVLVLTLVPGDWTEKVIQDERTLVMERLGSEYQEWADKEANRWYASTMIENNLYQTVYDFLIPTEERVKASTGMQQLGRGWFAWVEGRLQTLANVYFQFLSRYALLLAWLPYACIIFLPALFDGYNTWQIRRTNYSYPSPLIHQLSFHGIFFTLVALAALFLAPIVLDPLFIPFALILVSLMAGLVLSNFQKRI